MAHQNRNDAECGALFHKRSSREYQKKKKIDHKKCSKKQEHLKKSKNEEQKTKLIQPTSSWKEYVDASDDDDVGKDLEDLMNAPISAGGHFVFNSEKNWSVDLSQYSEFFTLDLETLSAAINCIPFNKYIEVEDKYFTFDQLTNISNAAEEGKNYYEAVLSSVDSINLKNTTDCINEINKTNNEKTEEDTTFVQNLRDLRISKTDLVNSDSTEANNIEDSTEEDLDFLLSLKEPVQCHSVTVTSPTCTSYTCDMKQSKNIPNKPIDLEKWLDSVLDD